MTELEASRRNLISGLAAAGVAVPLLAACGDNNSSSSGDVTGDTGSSSGDSPSTSTSASGSAGADAGGIKTSDIPVGGGKIYSDDKTVVTQPAAGEFKAFSAVCTHQGCLVSKVADGTIDCSCHGSRFSIEDGSVENGPATKALSEKTVTVSGDSLTVG